MRERMMPGEGKENEQLLDIESNGGLERIPDGDREGVMKELLQRSLQALWNKQRGEQSRRHESKSQRVFSTTHFDLEEGGKLARQSVESFDHYRRQTIEALEGDAQVMIEGLAKVKAGSAPSDEYFAFLDRVEVQLASEVARAHSHAETFDNPRSKELLEVARNRLSAVSDYKNECLALLSRRVDSKGREH